MDKAIGKRVETMSLINTQEYTKTIPNMAMVSLNGVLVASTRENIQTTKRKAMEKCTGWMVIFIEVSGIMEFSMV